MPENDHLAAQPTQIIERRKNPTQIPSNEAAMLHLLENLQNGIDELKKAFADHTTQQKADLEAVVKNGFPDGDPDGHRRYHEAEIKAAEERAKFWAQMRIEGAKWAGLGALAFAASAAWHEFIKNTITK